MDCAADAGAVAYMRGEKGEKVRRVGRVWDLKCGVYWRRVAGLNGSYGNYGRYGKVSEKV